MMNRIPCPLCGSYQHRVFWRSESYPAIGGKVVPPECSPRIPWLPLELALCDHCQHIYQSQPPDERELDAFYEGSYVSANPSPALGGTPPRGLEIFLRAILEATGSTRGRAMEIGAYDGYFLHRLVQEGWQAVGYEPSKMGEIGRDFFNVDIHRDFYRPGKSSEVWDLVVSRYVFEHLSSPVEMLRGVWSELSAEGWLALEVPDMQSRLEVGVLGCFAHEHISYFVSSTLCSLVEAAGFTVRKLSNSRDGLMVVAQKAGRHSETPPGREAAPAGNNAALVRQFLDRREQQKSAFARELNLWDGPRNYYVRGDCTLRTFGGTLASRQSD